MDHGLVDTFLAKRELVWRHTDVPLLEQVAALVGQVECVAEDPEPDVELAAVYQQGTLDVLLNHEHIRLHIRLQIQFGLIGWGLDVCLLWLKIYLWAEVPLGLEDLDAEVVNIEVHLVACGKVLHELAQLLKGVEQHHSSSTVEVIWLNQPHIASIEHLVAKSELPVGDRFESELRLNDFVLLNQVINLTNCIFSLLLPFNLFDNVKVLAEPVDLRDEALALQVNDKLYRQVLEDIKSLLLTEPMHVEIEHVFGRELIVPLEMVHQLLLSVLIQLFIVNQPGNWRPSEVENCEVFLFKFSPPRPGKNDSLDQLRVIAFNNRHFIKTILFFCDIFFWNLVVLFKNFLFSPEYFKVLIIRPTELKCLILFKLYLILFKPI